MSAEALLAARQHAVDVSTTLSSARSEKPFRATLIGHAEANRRGLTLPSHMQATMGAHGLGSAVSRKDAKTQRAKPAARTPARGWALPERLCAFAPLRDRPLPRGSAICNG